MKKEIQNMESRGLPGGPNEMFTYTTGVFSTEGFRIDSPDVNNYQNIIPSGSITMTERDGSPLKKGPIYGVDNLGNAQVMYPGFNYQFPGTEVTETLMAKMGGALLDKTIKCGNCGWEWKAADGGSDVMDCHKCGGKGLVKAQTGIETKPLGAGKYYTTTGKVVDWGTPEYETAYNRGEVLSDKGVPSEVTMQGGTLPEVVVKNNYKRGFLEKYRDKIVEENKDAGPLGAIIGAPLSAAFSLPQMAVTSLFNDGNPARPSELIGFENNEGLFESPTSFGKHASNFVLDVVTDPLNLIGAGILTKENTFSKLGKIPTSITPELRQGLKTNGFLDMFKSKKPITTSVENVTQPVISKPWEIQNLPGLHLQSTMDNGAISRIVEPKSGLINTEQALAIIGKEAGGADKVALIKQGLGETIPKKMDYNDFRKTVQEQLVPLDVQINPNANSSYGVSSIGYDGKNRDMKLIQQELQDFISGKNTDISSLSKGTRGVITGEGNISIIDANAFSKTGIPEFLPLDTILNKVKSNDALLDIAYNKKYINSKPLENQTITFSNKNKFGKGSAEHNNPDETLGHAHYLIDAETPNIINLTQLQSDALQGTHRIMPKTFKPEMAQHQLTRMQETQQKNIATLNKMKAEGAADYEIKQMQEIVDAQELRNALEKGHVENFTQKSLLDKDHQARFFQEFVNYAAQKGNINKVRVPTSETAANVQGYGQLIQTGDNAPGFAKLQEEISIATRQGNQEKVNELMKVHDKMLNTPYRSYNTEHQTILKKYSEQPKLIKKLFGQDAKIVTDSKGNTWYEFDIPKNFKEGKGQIKAFAEGGESKLGPLMQAYNKLATEKKMGGAITNKKQFGGQLNAGNIILYKDYIKGNIINEVQAIKNYDKLNRVYYSKAKDLGMSTPNYIMTHIVGNS